MRLIRTTTLNLPVDAIVGPPQFTELLEGFREQGVARLFTFVNPGAIALTRRVIDYHELLAAFDAVLPDGIGMCWAVRLLHKLRAARVSFDTTSFAPAVMEWAVSNHSTVALVGGRPGVALKAAEQLVKAYPKLEIALVLDGFGDWTEKIEEIRRHGPDIVICGMGAGQQERFLLSLTATGWSGFGFTCGGYLDQLADGLHYYPAWIDAGNLRWAYRLFREPRRLARRYLIDYGLFAGYLAHALVTGRRGAQQQRRPVSLAP